MARLDDLTVDKISFVRSAANKRKWLLLKSKDVPITEKENGGITLRDEIKKAISKLFKEHKDPDKVLSLLSADTTLKLTDTEKTESKELLAFLDTTVEKNEKPPEKPPETKPTEKAAEAPVSVSKADFDKLQKEHNDLVERTQKSEIRKFLKEECNYAGDDIEKTVSTLFRLDKSDPEAATAMRESLKRESIAMRNSSLFSESGRSGENLSTGDIGAELMQAIKTRKSEVKKSGEQMKESDIICSVINENPDKFRRYRAEHIQRARTEVQVV